MELREITPQTREQGEVIIFGDGNGIDWKGDFYVQQEVVGGYLSALRDAAQALAEASTELDAAGCQRAASYAHEQNRIAWETAVTSIVGGGGTTNG
jgi:hypothetical protein